VVTAARSGRRWTARLDAYQRRHRRLGFPIAVIYKFADDQGNYLAALITYYGFLSLFPLLLLLAAILGVVLDGDPSLQRDVLSSALSQFPVIGNDLSQPEQLGGSTVGIVVGSLVLLYGGLGIAQALQNAMNVAWGVPRNQRPNPLRARLRSIRLLGLGGLAVIGTTILSALGSSANSYGASVGVPLRVVLTASSVCINGALFVLLFVMATTRTLRFRDVAPGAILAAVIWQVLQSFGALILGTSFKHASTSNGVFGLVLGLIGFIYLEAVAIVFCVELNVVRLRGLYPRALLTPFTDDVQLTSADESAYASYAQAQRHKGFQRIGVGFDDADTRADARAAGRKHRRDEAPAAPDEPDQPTQGPGP
jgi:membrane protein